MDEQTKKALAEGRIQPLEIKANLGSGAVVVMPAEATENDKEATT